MEVAKSPINITLQLVSLLAAAALSLGAGPIFQKVAPISQTQKHGKQVQVKKYQSYPSEPMQRPKLERCNCVKKGFSRSVGCENSVLLSCHRLIYKDEYIVDLLQLQSPNLSR